MDLYVALFRGINVGGNKKVAMSDLAELFEKLGCTDVKTVIASGNVLFSSPKITGFLERLETAFVKKFGFSSSVILIPRKDLLALKNGDPFKGIPVTENTRLNVTFLKENRKDPQFPYRPKDSSFVILGRKGIAVFSAFEKGKSGTVDVMKTLEQFYGNTVTTRTWETVLKLC